MTTKELIIEEAFSFYKKPNFVDFSMNELALKVGISKPAIYRHFKNKDALIDAMQEKFIDLLSVRLLEVQNAAKNGKEASRIPFAATIQFFADNPEYINYFISNFATKENYEKIIQEKLILKGIKSEKSIESLNESTKEKFSRSFYCGVSLLYFIKVRERILAEKKITKSNNKFSLNLIDFLIGGFKNLAENDEIVKSIKISKKRFSELDKLCEINENDFPKEDRFFSAFASVLKNCGFQGTTLEKIADELNMAKSSLYFYFDNKNEMMKSLIFKELSLLSEIVRENSVEAKSYFEFIYILMRTELSYFKIRPSLMPILGWLLQTSGEKIYGQELEVNNIWEKKLIDSVQMPNLGFSLKPEYLSFWYSTLCSALILISLKHKIDYENQVKILKDMFDFIQFGVGEDCK